MTALIFLIMLIPFIFIGCVLIGLAGCVASVIYQLIAAMIEWLLTKGKGYET